MNKRIELWYTTPETEGADQEERNYIDVENLTQAKREWKKLVKQGVKTLILDVYFFDKNEDIIERKTKHLKLKGNKFVNAISLEEKPNKKELKRGIKIEREHFKSLKRFLKPGVKFNDVAKAIAGDHIKEDKKFYSKMRGAGLKENKREFKFKHPLLKPKEKEKKRLIKQALAPPFNEKGKTTFNLRHRPGVYMIYEGKTLVYVGFSKKDVYKALYRHFYPYREHSRQVRYVYDRDAVKVRVIYVRTAADADRLEKALNIKLKPRDNAQQYSIKYEVDDKEQVIYDHFTGAPVVDIITSAKDIPF